VCGIVAIHDLSSPDLPAAPSTALRAQSRADADLGARMLARLPHRGPDGTGHRVVGPTWLGHTRLSIVDLEGGDQPMADATGERWVVCNGEIYNHEAVRADLDWAFRTRSDSEVALAVVGAHGPAGVRRLRGMFAFVTATPGGQTVAARDPLGIKPLYWARVGSRMVFASELRAFDAEHRPLVEEFPPGHLWSPDTGLVRYHHLDEEPALFATAEEARADLRGTLVEAVRRRMMADVPIGVFLSGGLDSSLVAAIMADQAAPGQTIHSFAAGTADSSDLRAARRVAEHLGLEHHERVYTADDVVAALPSVVTAMEAFEPSLVRSAVPNFLLAELAARHVKVVLTGEGADELYAGYDHLREIAEPEDLQAELVRSVEGLHNLNLQRCDRVTMAHGLEARVPFLDLDVIATAQRVPIEWKLPGELGQEKRILREAFEGWLPSEVLWRRKEQFGDGSGTAAVMAERARELAPDDDWRTVSLPGMPAARSREEMGYQRLFHQHLHGVRVDRLLGRFATA
jgi:asparagine synthase (glutamine-hydrolysing)